MCAEPPEEVEMDPEFVDNFDFDNPGSVDSYGFAVVVAVAGPAFVPVLIVVESDPLQMSNTSQLTNNKAKKQ